MKIYIDGRFLEKEDAKVSVFDHGLLYGDGVFEGIRAYNGRVFMLDEHIDRLFDSCRGILIEPVWTKEEIKELTLECLRQNSIKDGYVRLLITRGVGDLGIDIRKCARPSIIIIAGQIQLYPEAFYKKGLDVITSSIRRLPAECLNPNIKSLNYLNNAMARAEATRANAAEAVMLNLQGYVAECTGDNIFYKKDGAWHTPPVSAGLLEGITRNVVMKLIKEKMKMEMTETFFTTFQLYQAEEIFLTGSGAEVVPVVRMDGRPVGDGTPGKTTAKLISIFREYAASSGTPIYKTARV